MLVGGLGLGYTAAELLAADVEHLDVVEIEDCLVEWAYAGLTPTLAAVAADARVALHTGDVAAVLTGRQPDLAGPWDAILLDVDNGPDFLIHGTNAGLYTRPTLAAAYARLADGGTLAIWCQGPAPDLLAAPARLSPSAQPHPFTRVRDGPHAGVRDLHGDQGASQRRGGWARMWAMTAPAGDGEFRIERDTMGEVRVPTAALYRAQTQRAVENFPISGRARSTRP